MMEFVTLTESLEFWVQRLQEFELQHEGEADPEQLRKVELFREVYLRRIREMEADK